MKSDYFIRYSILRGIMGLILGFFLIIRPEGSVITLVRLLAAVLLVGGIFAFYFALQNKKSEEKKVNETAGNPDKGLQRLLFLTSFAFLTFGILLLLFPGSFTKFAMFLAGIVLLLSSLTQIVGIIQFRRTHSIGLPLYVYINPLVIFILSIVILINPFRTAVTLAVFTGILFLAYAFTEILQAVVEYRLFKKKQQ